MSGGNSKKKKAPLHEYPDREIGTELYSHVGLESIRRNSIHCLRGPAGTDAKDEWVITAAGNVILFIELATGRIQSMQGPNDGGIGTVCVHPDKPLFVVGEKGDEPLVRVHEWPSKRRVNVMKNGAVQGFSACSFNDKGNLLATVAIEPDFVITVWDWERESIVLRNKAFGADVYDVTFNPFNDGLLTSSGSGHIKFWTMATTFTGLKLQGEVGKFGRLEISDVCASASLPDGKVISGSESGSLLLWEGSLVKCELVNQTATDEQQRKLDEEHAASGAAEEEEGAEPPVAEPVKCHKGPIEVVRMIAKGKIIMTGGHDGYLRYWSAEEIDGAETNGIDIHVGIKLLKEYYCGDNIAINGATLTPNNQSWILQNAGGSIVRAPFWSYEVIMSSQSPPEWNKKQPICTFSAGSLHHMITSPTDHTCVTLGDDGSVRLVDYINAKELYHVKFNSAPVKAQFLDLETGDKDGRVLVVAFADGVLRVLRKTKNTFEGLHAVRPHVNKIIDFAIDPSSTQIYTVSTDGTAFYLKLRPLEFTLEAIGYCELPGTATSNCWTSDGGSCLISFNNGHVIALKAPKKEDINYSESFQFDAVYAGLGFRQKKKPPEKPKNKEGEEEDDEDENDLEEEDVGPWGVNFVARCPDNTYMIGMDKEELCYTYSGNIRYDGRTEPTPLPATGIEPPNWVEEPILNYAFRDYTTLGTTTSYSKKINIIVCERNKVLVRQFGKIDNIVHTTQLHDGIHGHTNGAMMSYDDKLLVTAGSDGMVFAHRLTNVESPPTSQAADLSKLAAGSPASAEAVERSVQQQKEFDDQERAEEAAMGKKAATLKRIKQVHEKYEVIAKVNREKSGGQRIGDGDMQLDPDLYQLLDEELTQRVADCAVEYSWESAQKEVQLQKLKSKFVDSLQYDHFCLYSFASDIVVRSFRTPHFTEHQKRALESIQELLAAAQEEGVEDVASQGAAGSVDNGSLAGSPVGSPTAGGSNSRSPGASPTRKTTKSPEFPDSQQGQGHADPGQVPMDTVVAQSQQLTTTKKGEKAHVKSQLEKAEERKRERIERRKGHNSLLQRRPKNSANDDPAFLQEILQAERFMGEHNLKSSPNYTIQEHSRPTADRKSKQLILLEHSIIELRAAFNVKLLGMRDLKRRLCVQLNKDRSRIKEISAQLKQEVDFTPFSLVPSEEPEKRFDVSHEELERFEKEAARQRRREEAAARAKKGFGGDLAQADDEPEEEDDAPTATVAPVKSMRRKPSTNTLQKERLDNDIKNRCENAKRSETEDEEAAIARELLLMERARLERKVTKTIQAFDDLLLEYFNEKLKLDADLCMADMRVLLLFREFRLLSEFKKRDAELQAKANLKKNEINDIQAKMDAIEAQREACVPIVSGVHAAMVELEKRFFEIVEGKEQDVIGRLEHIYKKAGLLAKRRKGEEGSDDDEASSDESEDGDEDEEDIGGEEVCPNNCDEETFQAILALRELKLDQDEIMEEKAIVYTPNPSKDGPANTKLGKKLYDEEKALKDRKANLEKDLAGVEKEERAFQNEKQRQLNLLSTIVVLKLSQIQCLQEDGKLPAVYDDRFVVFTQNRLDSLRARIVELAEKKQAKKKEDDSLVHERARIMRKRSRKQVDHQDWEAKVYEVQLLKFGQRVDLEMLENVAVDRETEELKALLKVEEVKWEKELAKQSTKLGGLRQDQQARIADNTVLLKDLGSLRAQQHDIEERLSQSTQKVVAKMSGGSKVATASDRAHLKDLVVAQQQEIDALKNEIAMLRRKGGHVYTPVVNQA